MASPVDEVEVVHRELVVRATDGWALAADLLAPADVAPRAAVVLAPALAVPRAYYRALAIHLAAGGLAVLSIDYRGVGESRPSRLRGFPAALHDWADLDLTAALAHVRGAYPGLPVAWFGHSMGGQLFGLLREPAVDRVLLVGAQHGHWRHWPGPSRYLMAALWHVVIPGMVAVAGRLPMGAVGRGEDVPPEVAREWARWGRDRDYVVGFAHRRGGACAFDTYAGPLRAYAISDDRYAPATTVRPLIEAFRATRGELIEVAPASVGARALGHFGVFSRDRALPLWDAWRAWLGGA
ncbi:MAG: alpha/beta fold hydrolase [Kofleriaceae bacterium]|nr:alpha/beta fold hydrolase [Kofleriaceae bacterium]MCB9573418.1 alpha/beta fold hydrolase [Kofleriaceae bacterium]